MTGISIARRLGVAVAARAVVLVFAQPDIALARSDGTAVAVAFQGGGFGGGFGPGWGWGLGGLGLGLYFATLPYYYSTYWWGGVPYYYADNTYYIWNSGVGQYQTVAPPAEVLSQAGGQAAGPAELIAYPKNGQSEEQLGKDKFECHRWAASQTGFDPTQVGGGSAPGKRSEYFRAQAACLEGRGYSVK